MEKYSTGAESDQESSDRTSSESTNENSLSWQTNSFLTRIIDLRRAFKTYLSQIPVIRFNSGKYDINLIKEEIMLYVASN